MEFLDWLYIALAALTAGFMNALAGGGTLITFPVLTALGLPAVTANVTNTVALCPGYFGGTWAQRFDLRAQQKRIAFLLPLSVLGGIAGGYLLLITGEKLFRGIVPWLILLAVLLFAFQPFIKKLGLKTSPDNSTSKRSLRITALAVVPGAAYGGYFGAGLGVVLLAVLGLSFHDTLARINALKQLLSLATNVAAATFFVFSDQVNWGVALLMAFFALLGGMAGGKLASRMKPGFFRWIIVVAGLGVFVYMLLAK